MSKAARRMHKREQEQEHQIILKSQVVQENGYVKQSN